MKTEKKENFDLQQIDQGAKAATKTIAARLPVDAVEYLHRVSEREGLDLTRTLLLVLREHQRQAESPLILSALANLQDSMNGLRREIKDEIFEELADIKADLASTKSSMLTQSQSIKEVVDYVSCMTPVSEPDLDSNPVYYDSDPSEPMEDLREPDEFQIVSMKKPKTR